MTKSDCMAYYFLFYHSRPILGVGVLFLIYFIFLVIVFKPMQQNLACFLLQTFLAHYSVLD